ncbi:MAG: hypothetical protein KTR25_18645 [Myxococcales bacterium]|nr:hypothetical protein [Myxococcales bacterium]
MADGRIVNERGLGCSGRGHGRRRLIVSALPEEQAPLRRRMGVGVRGKELEEVNGVWLGVTGDGALSASRKLREFIRRAQPDHIVAIGLGGGVSEALPIGALVEGCSVRLAGSQGRSSPLHRWLENPPHIGGQLVSTPRILGSAIEKAALWHELGRPASVVVDLESWAYAQVAQDAEIPMSVLKVVSDGAGEDLPFEVVASSRPDGSIRRSSVVARALCNPSSWRHLSVLRRRLNMAAQRLADVVQEALLVSKSLE